MKFLRYRKDKPEYRGILDGENIIRVNGTIFHDYSLTTESEKYSDVEILTPIIPSKIIGARANYGAKNSLEIPKLFMKPQSSIIATKEGIIYPENEKSVRVEGELAVIIGKKCSKVTAEHAMHYVLGFTIANDVTSPSVDSDITVTLGKFYDTYLPIGPYINTDVEYNNLNITTYKNNEVVQSGNTKDLIFSVEELISYISSVTTLLPGDVILTGTPGESCEVKVGDIIRIEIDELGVLENHIIK